MPWGRKRDHFQDVALPPAKLLASVRGLPNGTDDDVLLTLIQIIRKRGFDSRRMNLSLYELVKLLGWDDVSKSYDRADRAAPGRAGLVA